MGRGGSRVRVFPFGVYCVEKQPITLALKEMAVQKWVLSSLFLAATASVSGAIPARAQSQSQHQPTSA